jgi:hypothetical protein
LYWHRGNFGPTFTDEALTDGTKRAHQRISTASANGGREIRTGASLSDHIGYPNSRKLTEKSMR